MENSQYSKFDCKIMKNKKNQLIGYMTAYDISVQSVSFPFIYTVQQYEAFVWSSIKISLKQRDYFALQRTDRASLTPPLMLIYIYFIGLRLSYKVKASAQNYYYYFYYISFYRRNS